MQNKDVKERGEAKIKTGAFDRSQSINLPFWSCIAPVQVLQSWLHEVNVQMAKTKCPD